MADQSAPTAAEALDDFVALSSILTGIAKEQLHPKLDTYGTAKAYLAYIEGGPQKAAFDAMMALYASNRQAPPEQIARLIVGSRDQPSGTDVAYMARAVILMWYLGAWYDPGALKAFVAGQPTSSPPSFVVVSSEAYTQGWAWRVAQAHPMGYSDLRFGYWQSAPRPLSDFVGA